jgi:hypothetical protein
MTDSIAIPTERLIQLNSTAITQMKSLLDNRNLMKRLKQNAYICKNIVAC